MENSLVNMKCQACEGSMPALDGEQIKEFMLQLSSDWNVSSDNKLICKIFHFKTYKNTIAFVNLIAKVAEQERHHPDLGVHYGKVVVNFTTHAVDGLTENDFICASKIEQLQQS